MQIGDEVIILTVTGELVKGKITNISKDNTITLDSSWTAFTSQIVG